MASIVSDLPPKAVTAINLTRRDGASEGESPRPLIARIRTAGNVPNPDDEKWSPRREDVVQLAKAASDTAADAEQDLRHLDEDATDKSMSKIWGYMGRWHVSSDMPARSEVAFKVRGYKMLPRSREPPASVLQRHGLSAICMKGQKGFGDTTVGQDTFCTARISAGWRFHSVCDGHGKHGDWVSRRVVTVLPYFLTTQECRRLIRAGNVEEALKIAFARVQKDVVRKAKEDSMDITLSGTTAACILREMRTPRIWVATVGDSRIILIRSDGTVAYSTTDHNAKCPKERARVLNSGCELVNVDMGEGHESQDRVCIAGRGEYPMLAFTRSFGDMCVKEKGVHADPEILRWDTADLEDGYIFAASDGVWEFMSNEEVGELVMNTIKRGASGQEALQLVLEESKSRWEEHEGDYCDDISAVLIPVKQVTGLPPVPDDRCLHFSVTEVCHKGLDRCTIQ